MQHIAVAQIVVVRHGRIQKHVRHLGWVIGNLSNSSQGRFPFIGTLCVYLISLPSPVNAGLMAFYYVC